MILLDSEIQTVNDIISKVKSDIKAIEDRFVLDKMPYSASMVIDALKGSLTSKTKKEEPKDFLVDLIDQYVAAHALNREAGYLTVFKSVKTHLLAYQVTIKETVRIETIDYNFFQRFQTFLINNGKLKNNTIAKALSTLKTLLAYAGKTGIKVNDNYKGFSIKREKLEVIALNESEFTALLNMDLSQSKRLEQVRDVFCFSCASGLRISDMQQLKREHIKSDYMGITVKKTKTELTIPLNRITSAILDKYKDQHKPLPLISSQKLNTYIKELCKKAKINEPIEIVRFRGSKRETETLPKHDLIHLHTGRKTFCTLSLEKGMSAEQVMSISGHTDYKSFKRYVDVTEKLKKVVMIKAWGDVPKLKAV
jgi:integrase